jgi:DNA-binding transcriptional MerR regulator
MRIGDAAAAAGTTPRALRFYEENGLLHPPRRTAAGQRLYGPADVDRIRVIVQRRIAALDAEITRLTRLRDQLTARVMASSRVA